MPKNSRETQYLGILNNIDQQEDDAYWWIHDSERAVEEIAKMEEVSTAVISARDKKLIRE